MTQDDMKVCIGCNKTKSHNDFHRDKKAKDNCRSRCKACTKKQNRNYPKKSTKEWGRTNKEKTYAHSRVQSAIKWGILTKENCVICDDPKSQGHHEDYSKPLDVIWLCQSHHRQRHEELKNG